VTITGGSRRDGGNPALAEQLPLTMGVVAADDACWRWSVEDKFDLSQYGACMNWDANRIHAVNVGASLRVLC